MRTVLRGELDLPCKHEDLHSDPQEKKNLCAQSRGGRDRRVPKAPSESAGLVCSVSCSVSERSGLKN